MSRKIDPLPLDASPSAMQVVRRYLKINAGHTHLLVLTVLFSLLSSATLGFMAQVFQA